MDNGKPTYMELVSALRQAPPPQSMPHDQRYWDWYNVLVAPLLQRAPEPK